MRWVLVPRIVRDWLSDVEQQGTKTLRTSKEASSGSQKESKSAQWCWLCGWEISKIILSVFRSSGLPRWRWWWRVHQPMHFVPTWTTYLARWLLIFPIKAGEKNPGNHMALWGNAQEGVRITSSWVLSSKKLRKTGPSCAHRPESWHRR